MTASTYVQLSDGNGGLMANLSKTGFCVRAAKTLETDQLPVVRFQLPDARNFVESSAWIVWKSPSKKTVGARFENLSDEAQSQIAQWIDSQPLPKTASIKNPLSRNRLSPNPPANRPLEQREKISPSPKIPGARNGGSVTLMSPDSVPIPLIFHHWLYHWTLSLQFHPQTIRHPHPSPGKSAAHRVAKQTVACVDEKTLAPVPAIIPAPSSAKRAAVTSTPVSPQPQKPLSRPCQCPRPSRIEQ